MKKPEYCSFSDPASYEAYEERIRDSMQNLTPEYVFMTMDEIRGFNRDSRAKKRGLENYEVLGNFINNIIDFSTFKFRFGNEIIIYLIFITR